MLRGPTSRWRTWRAWQEFPRGMRQVRHVFPRGTRTMRCLLTRVLLRRTKTKSQLARPTGVVARGVAIARETRTAVTVNTASGHGATAIAKDAGLTIWRGRPKRCLLTRVLPRRTKTMCQLARPTGVVARGVAIAWETGTAFSVTAATTSGHGASASAKDARLTIWHREHSAAATEHRKEVLLLRCRRRRARSRNRGSRALLLLQYSSTELGACGCCRA